MSLLVFNPSLHHLLPSHRMSLLQGHVALLKKELSSVYGLL